MTTATNFESEKSRNGRQEPGRNGKTDVNQLPPRSLEAEKATLGAMMRDNRKILDVCEMLIDEDFYVFGHQVVFRAARELHLRDRKPVDLVTLADKLHVTEGLEDAGGYAYLVDLWEGAPSAANATHYAKIVQAKAKLRELDRVLIEVRKDIYDANPDAQEVLESAERRIYAVNHSRAASSTSDLEAAMMDAATRADLRKANGGVAFGLASGFNDLDRMTNGFQPGEVIVIAGRTSVGKTAFAINLFRNAVADNKRAVFFSLEQSKAELTDRLICIDSLIEAQRLKRGEMTPGEGDRFMDSMDRLRRRDCWINDSPGRSVLQMFAECRRLKMKYGLDAVFVDYLQIVQPFSRREPREQQIAGVSRELKAMARELAVPVIVAAQLNRQAENARPKLSDLRESGAIEQDADSVIFLHDPNRAEQTHGAERGGGDIEVILAKQRNGPTGDFMVHFYRQYTRFFNFGETVP